MGNRRPVTAGEMKNESLVLWMTHWLSKYVFGGFHSFSISSGALKGHYITVHVHLILKNGKCKQTLLYEVEKFQNENQLRFHVHPKLHNELVEVSEIGLSIIKYLISYPTPYKKVCRWHLLETVCEYVSLYHFKMHRQCRHFMDFIAL